MRILTTIILLALVLVGSSAQTGSILIELTANSQQLREWEGRGRSGSISSFTSLLGEHTCDPYILTSTLRAVERTEMGRLAKRRLDSTTEQLRRFAVVTFTGPRNAAVLAAKLRHHGLVQQAQVLPEQRIVGQPNDPEVFRQYYLPLIDAYRAWDVVPSGRPAVVAIVDTGIDTLHSDLQGSLWHNTGESGRDSRGLDKRTNGVDDDNNGFVDDWFGWDFVGADGKTGDNTPLPGNPHGTHVGGIVAAQINNAIGMAGVGKNVVVMPIKVGRDDPSSESVARSADAILYAAAMRADVINCSFGSTSPTFADITVVQKATQLGSLVIGAAGNEASEQAFYPAAYAEAVSVAATGTSDRVALFSNVHSTVDVCAPGVGIFSTIPRNTYTSYDGTSMATPVVSAIAAMVRQCFPSYTPAQVRAALIAGCDNIDTLNPGYQGLIGMGRVNAFRSCSGQNARWCVVSQANIADSDGDGVFVRGDTLDVRLTIRNILSDLSDARVVVRSLDTTCIVLDSTAQIGPLSTDTERQLPGVLRIQISQASQSDARFTFRAFIYDGDQIVGSEVIAAVANPTYATLEENDIAVSVNSVGNIGYNDYSSNEQGVGFRYQGSSSILFEGALMIGVNGLRVSNVARGLETGTRDMSFVARRNATIRSDSVVTGKRVATIFDDDGDLMSIGVAVDKNVYARTDDSLRNSILVVLKISNITSEVLENIYSAYFFDFDIGPNGANNVTGWDSEMGAYVIANVVDPSLPRVAMAMVSPLPVNGFAVDNDGAPDCPSIYDSFTIAEKWFMMSQGLRRRVSNSTDASTVIGAGPFTLEPGQSQEVAFILVAGTDRQQLLRGLTTARNAASNQGVDLQPYQPLPYRDAIIHVDGAPLVQPGATEIVYSLTAPSSVTIDMIDITGRSVAPLFSADNVYAGDHRVGVEIPEISQGAYFIRLTTERASSIVGIAIIR